jgi:hypothetical protein
MVNKRILYYGLVSVTIVSLLLVFAGEFDTMLAWWLTILLLLPPLFLAYKTNYVALKTICSISFATQFFTLPFFYLYRGTFPWGHVKPFNFTWLEAFPILAKVSLFLFALIFFFRILYSFTVIGGKSARINKNKHTALDVKKYLSHNDFFDVRHNKNSVKFSLIICILIFALTFLSIWSYSQGIGLTGVEPPALPFRLSGILFYTSKYITPLILGYLYIKTKRGWLLMFLFMSYAWVLGLCSVSKGAVMIVMLPIITLAWLDNRKTMFMVAGLGALIGVSTADGARAYVHIVVNGKAEADTSLSIFTVLGKIFSDPDSPMWNLNFLPYLIYSIVARIEGFGNLIMAKYYDPDAVIGSWGFILRMIWRGLCNFDINLHSMQWQGNILPYGFYNGGALLSNAIIVSNSGLFWIILSSVVSAIILIILEKSCKRISSKWHSFYLINNFVVSFLSLLFFLDTGGSEIFVFPLAILFITSYLMPKFNLNVKSKSNISN